MKISKNPTDWAVEAAKYHLSYGRFVQEVEHGNLLPPIIAEASDTKRMQTCLRCGEAFELKPRYYRGHIKYSEAQYCDDCRMIIQCRPRKRVSQ